MSMSDNNQFRIRIFLSQSTLSKDSIFLSKNLNHLIQQSSKDYIWHKDPPFFFPSTVQTKKAIHSKKSSGSSSSTNVNSEFYRYLIARMKNGDALIDEW